MARWRKALTAWVVLLLALAVPAGLGAVPAAGATGVSVSITSPTRSYPVSVRPGAAVKVTFRYTADQAIDVRVALLSADGDLLAEKEVALAAASSSRTKSVSLLVPSTAEPGRYRLAVRLGDGTELDAERDAVVVTENVSVEIVSPTKSAPASVEPGGEVDVQLRYTAGASAKAEVRLVDADDEAVASETVTLSKASTSRRTAVTLDVPAWADPGEYDLAVVGAVSGAELAREADAVVVEAQVEVDIESPTRSAPAEVAAGGRVTVEFRYRAGAATEVEVKIVDSGGDPVARTTTTLRKATSTRTASVSLTLPSQTAAGRYDLVVARTRGAVLDRERGAVVVEAPVTAEIVWPTQASPARVAAGQRVNVRLSYAAPAGAEVEVALVKADGSALTTARFALSAAASRTTTLGVAVPAGAAAGAYGLRVTDRGSGRELDVERQAVVVAAVAGKTVRLVVGVAGRWVDGAFQTTDCAPVLREGRVFLPIRHVGEPLGWSLAWEPLLDRATVTRGDLVVKLYLGKRGAEVSRDGGQTWEVKAIDPENPKVWPFVVGSRVMLPLGFVAASLGAKVSWDGKTQSVTVKQ